MAKDSGNLGRSFAASHAMDCEPATPCLTL
jgi:hypothetical protein